MKHISTQALKERIDAGEALHIIDVREPDEYAELNINAKLVPLSQLRNMESDTIEEWKEEEIIVHCRSGKRSMEACKLLETMGFENVVSLDGGIMEWIEKYGDTKLS